MLLKIDSCISSNASHSGGEGIQIYDLKQIDYLEALKVQQDILSKRINKTICDALIILEHFPVITLGRLSSDEKIRNLSYFENNNIPVINTNRGGDITCHLPGQIVLYPIIDLRYKEKNISRYIDFLEFTITNSLNALGIPAQNIKRRGVWVGKKKIAFIGISLKSWVTYHGIAININNCIESFKYIDPCGEADILVTSAKSYLGRELDLEMVKQTIIDQFVIDLRSFYSS